jgi:hypothetical protein
LASHLVGLALVVVTSGKPEKYLIWAWRAYCRISTNKYKISQIHPRTQLMPSHFGLICHLNHLNLHLMYLIKCAKTISHQRQISFFLIFLMYLQWRCNSSQRAPKARQGWPRDGRTQEQGVCI